MRSLIGSSGIKRPASLRARLAALVATGELGRVIRYGVVGGSGIVVNLAVLTGLSALGVALIPATVAGIELSILSNYALNSRFTFGQPLGLVPAINYNLFGLLCSSPQVPLVALFVGFGLSKPVAGFGAIVPATILNYGLNRFITFRAGLRKDAAGSAGTPV